MTNWNGLLKELYEDVMFFNFHWNNEKTQFYYDINHMLPLSVMLGLEEEKKTVIFELTDG